MRPAHDGTPVPPADRGGKKTPQELSSLIRWIGGGDRKPRQQTVGSQPEDEPFALGEATPDAVPFAVPDGVGRALADHRAASADRLRTCLAGGPLGTPFTVGREENRAVDIPAGGPQPPRPQRRRTRVLKGFLPSIHVSSSQRRPHRPVSGSSRGANQPGDETTDSPVGWIHPEQAGRGLGPGRIDPRRGWAPAGSSAG